MLQVRKDLCLGCGLCAQNCPQQAIWLLWGQAEIDQSRCNLCRQCLELCPQGAIADKVPVSQDELQATLTALKQRADDLVERIERSRSEISGAPTKDGRKLYLSPSSWAGAHDFTNTIL